MLHVAGVEMQLTAAVSFLTVLQEESVSIHTYSHSFLHIILQNLEHRDAGQGCTAVLMNDYFYTLCFLRDCTTLCKAVTAVPGLCVQTCRNEKIFACWPLTYWYLNVVLIEASKTTLSEGLNPKLVTESRLLLIIRILWLKILRQKGWLFFCDD